MTTKQPTCPGPPLWRGPLRTVRQCTCSHVGSEDSHASPRRLLASCHVAGVCSGSVSSEGALTTRIDLLRDRMASGDIPPGASIIVGANGNLYALVPTAERTAPARPLAQTGLRGEPVLLPAARPGPEQLLSDGPLAQALLSQMLQQRQQQQQQEEQRLALLEQLLPQAVDRDESSSSALNSLLQASILQALQGQSGAGAPPSAPKAPQSRAPAAPTPRRQAARDMDSASMRCAWVAVTSSSVIWHGAGRKDDCTSRLIATTRGGAPCTVLM